MTAASPLGVVGAAAAQSIGDAGFRQQLCGTVDAAAAANRLPASFLTRVLWQESRFRSDAISPAGAQGVAQFMPQTAAERGLADPYDPGPAIAKAARLLADLDVRFGNLGLAAAAYNAGPARVTKWLHGAADLPGETQLYVIAVTGRAAEDWARRALPRTAGADGEPCLRVMADLVRSAPMGAGPRGPLDRALARAVRLLADLSDRRRSVAPGSLRAAEGLCDRVRSLGARCAVYRP